MGTPISKGTGTFQLNFQLEITPKMQLSNLVEFQISVVGLSSVEFKHMY